MSLIVDHLTKDYVSRSEPLSVLRDVSFKLMHGDAIAVTGPSGCGKSTLLHILGTLDTPSSGSVRIDDIDPFHLKERELAAFRNKRIGFVFQDHHLLPLCTVLENVLIPTFVDSDSKSVEKTEQARDLLNRVGLAERVYHRPAELSGGERQRVALARALIQKPKLLLADEPTGNLDQKTAHQIGELLLELHAEENNILVIVTHSPELAAMMPQHYAMDDGSLNLAGQGLS